MARGTPGSDPAEVEVELVDVEGDEHGSGAPTTGVPDLTGPSDGAGTAPTARTPRLRGRRAWPAVAVAVALVAVGGAQLVELGDEPTAAVVSGRLDPVPEAPVELWRADWAQWSFVDGPLVVHGSGSGMVARDLRTGEVVTDMTAGMGRCEPATDLAGQVVPTTVVLCLEDPQTVDGEPVMVLRAVRPADGHTLWERSQAAERWATLTHLVTEGEPTLRTPGSRALHPDEADVLWVTWAGDELTVLRIGLADGDVRWAAEVTERLPEGIWLTSRDGVVVLSDHVAFDLGTGEQVQTADVPASLSMSVRVPRGTARLEWSRAGDQAISVLGLDGTERLTIADAYPSGWGAVVSDRADVVVVGEPLGGTRVLDVRTGAELWRHDSAGSGPWDVAAYLPDVLIMHDGPLLCGYRPRTGEELWSVAADESAPAALGVDDRRLLVQAPPGTGGGVQAVDVVTGEVAWTLPFPHPVQELHGGDGVIVVQMAQGLVALGSS